MTVVRDQPSGDAALAWVVDRPAAVDRIRPAGHDTAHHGELPPRLLGELAAFSRVLERLTPVPGVFSDATGLSRIAEDAFHPFFHEIVAVEQADDPDEPIVLLDEVWPGHLLGSLLMQRAGVRVRAGTAHADATVAVTSRLHWASWRADRATVDTPAFRRDHHTGDALLYNVDARPELLRAGTGRSEPALSSCERLELLRHRCVLRRAGAAPTAWDWAGHLRYSERR